MYLTLALAMFRVLAKGVAQGGRAWGHRGEEAFGAELFRAQGGDHVCLPFRVSVKCIYWHFLLGLFGQAYQGTLLDRRRGNGRRHAGPSHWCVSR